MDAVIPAEPSAPPLRLTPLEVRTEATRLVQDHAERLGMDPFAASRLAAAVASISLIQRQHDAYIRLATSR